MERTFVMIKPDGVRKRIVGEIISKFEKKGLYLVKIGAVIPTDEILSQHYAEHTSKPFYKPMAEFFKSGLVIPMIWEGQNAVKICRNLMGATNPQDAQVGTIRSDYGMNVSRNIIHGSDSVESAAREIEIWFGKDISPVPFFDMNNYYE